jgi:hypothetical protein
MVGACGPGWTEAQIVAAVAHLEHAKASWSRHADRECARQRRLKRVNRNAHRPGFNEVFLAWIEQYLQADQAEGWRVAGLGDCERCGHRLMLHHGGRACLACAADPGVEWNDRCREPLPDGPIAASCPPFSRT